MSFEPLTSSGFALCACGLCLLGYEMALVEPLARPTLGERGLERQRFIASGAAWLEPLTRYVAALFAKIPLPERARQALQTMLDRAGGWLGLCPNELLALSALSATFACSTAWMCGLGAPWLGMLGAAVPLARLRHEARRRQRSIGRGLPTAIDLISLCVGAGLDFTGALRLVTAELIGHDDALRRELDRVLQQLLIGRPRKQALLGFAARVPIEAVRDFVAAVVQAEERGNPLARVLQIQAQVLRARRSVAAEEAAARASVLLIMPLILLLLALLLILLGPFLINGAGI